MLSLSLIEIGECDPQENLQSSSSQLLFWLFLLFHTTITMRCDLIFVLVTALVLRLCFVLSFFARILNLINKIALEFHLCQAQSVLLSTSAQFLLYFSILTIYRQHKRFHNIKFHRRRASSIALLCSVLCLAWLVLAWLWLFKHSFNSHNIVVHFIM